MADLRDGARFVEEATDELRIGRILGQENLDRCALADRFVLGCEHQAHTSLAELADELERADTISDA
jgi:hypothetical protein